MIHCSQLLTKDKNDSSRQDGNCRVSPVCVCLCVHIICMYVFVRMCFVCAYNMYVCVCAHVFCVCIFIMYVFVCAYNMYVFVCAHVFCVCI